MSEKLSEDNAAILRPLGALWTPVEKAETFVLSAAQVNMILNAARAEARPVDMVLHCPACGLQHIDGATPEWDNPPHRSHLCLGCGHIWRPADVATNGVAALQTRGKSDSPRSEARPAPVGLHPATADLVNRFAHALAEKLAKAEQKYGYSDGWARDDWQDECRRQLHHHAAKGDPRDVAAYAAFCWYHGWSTALLSPAVDREAVAGPAYTSVGYQYRFSDPMSGHPVWRTSSEQWNGQRPQETREIFALLSPATSPGEGSSGGRVQAAPDGATEDRRSAGEEVVILARALWLTAQVRGERTPGAWEEFYGWYMDGAADPRSCVHYSTIGLALQQARELLSSGVVHLSPSAASAGTPATDEPSPTPDDAGGGG